MIPAPSPPPAGLYLLHHWMLNQPHKYWQAMRQLVAQAQRADDDSLLRNPYLQISAMMAMEDSQAAGL